MIPRWGAAALIAMVLAAAGCAGDGPQDGGPRDMGGGPPGGRGGPLRPLPNTFISPAGEPFRAPAGAPYPVATWFAQANASGDGRLTRAQFIADGMKFFDRLDTNHDGVLDGAEVQNYEQTVAPEILPQIEGLHALEGMNTALTFGDPNNTDNRPDAQQPRRQQGQGATPPPRGIGTQGAAVFSLINAPEPVAAADEQFDGRITRAEFADTLGRRFDALDKTSRGYLTLADLPKTPIQQEIIKRAAAARRERARGGPAGPPPPG